MNSKEEVKFRQIVDFTLFNSSKVSFLVEKEWREEMHEAFSTRELAAIFAYVLVQQGKDAREMFRPLTMAKSKTIIKSNAQLIYLQLHLVLFGA